VTSPGVRRLADTLAGGASGKARHRVRLAAFVRAAAIFVGVWGVGALSTCLQAQPVSAPTRYPLQIEAPEPLARLVREFTLLGRWQRREDFDPGQMPLFLDRAPQEILDLLAAQGYFSAKVQVRAEGDGARILIDPGPLARIRQVHLLIESEDPEQGVRWQRELRRRWSMPQGQAFVSADWELAKRRLLEVLQEAGHLRARLSDTEAVVEADEASVDLRLSVAPGPALRFGPLQVQGLARYPAQVVSGLSPFRTGDPYDASKLALMQARLAGAGWFSTAHVRPDLAALEDDPALVQVPIRIDVVEHPAQRLSLSGGVDADRGPSAQVQWDHNNLWGAGFRLLNGLDLDPTRQRVFSTWELPQGSEGWRWQGGFRYERQDIRNDLVRAGGVFVARVQRAGLLERGWSLQWQDEMQSIGLSPDTERRDRNAALVLGWNWSLRDLDSPIFPTRGRVLNLQASAASDGLGSERSFLRGYAMAMQLLPVLDVEGREQWRWIVRAELGQVQATSREGIPSSNLFRTGGGKSIRGYGAQSLGVPVGEATLGGRVLAVASVEIQRSWLPQWAWAAFADVGDAADQWGEWRARRALGLGIRWRTPVGPLQVDLARGLDPGQWRLHTSLGVVF
jgi:translocation and assembly module TamA